MLPQGGNSGSERAEVCQRNRDGMLPECIVSAGSGQCSCGNAPGRQSMFRLMLAQRFSLTVLRFSSRRRRGIALDVCAAVATLKGRAHFAKREEAVVI